MGIVTPLDLPVADLPRSVPLIDGILVLLTTGGLRYSVRLAERLRQRRRNHSLSSTRVAIIGAGDAGAMIVKEMQANPRLALEPVVFLDDDMHKHGMWIHGVLVAGGREKISELARDYNVQQAIIAMPTAPGKTIRELTQLCQEANLPVKTVPGMFELLDGSVAVSQLRPVDITDLLRREPVVTDATSVADLLKGKRVLVTGAGGSIGSELCRQIARCEPAMLVLLGHGENSIFEICNELRRGDKGTGRQVDKETGRQGDTESRLTSHASRLTLHELRIMNYEFRIVPLIADLRDKERLDAIFSRFHPEIVFHAAAHKHVPLMEENVEDAVTNNVLGTRALLQVALASQVEHFVLVSTDKAVNPTSIMGATKRVAELLVQQAAAQSGGCFVAVRFGNVLGSRGSVVPFFRWQIAQGGPVTVTDPEVRRYFMTIPEAVQLVLQAATLGRCGEIFVLDMGEPIKIVDLARDLIRLSGLEEGRDIDIVFTGMRPGEKLFEELFAAGESYARTKHEKIFTARNGEGQLPIPNCQLPISNHQSPISNFQFPTSNLQSAVDSLIAAAQRGDADAVRQLLHELVPEYRPAERTSETVMQDVAPAQGSSISAGK